MKQLLIMLLLMFVIGCQTNAPTENTVEDNSIEPSSVAEEPVKDTAKVTEDKVMEKKSEATSTLKNFFAKSIKYKVTYNMESQGQKVELTQYFLNGKVRSDVTTQGIETRSFIVDDTLTSCNKFSGNWQCQNIAYDASQQEMSESVKDNLDQYNVQSIGKKTVAGVSTDCFRIVGESGTVDYCYSKDYVPLYVKTDAGQASSELIATSYSTSVSDSNFVPPVSSSDSIDPSDYLKNLPS